MARCNKLRCCVVSGASGAVILLTIAALAHPVMQHFLNKLIMKSVILKPGGVVFEAWKGSDTKPMGVSEVYVFSLKNKAEVINEGAKPVVIQRGPYVYTTFLKKYISWNTNGTLSFKQKQRLVFDRTKSVGPDTELITTINVPLITLLSYIQQKKLKIPFLDDILKYMLKEDVFITKSVQEIIWGYNDSLLVFAHSIDKSLAPNTTVGLFYGSNNTDGGRFTIYSGETDINKLGVIDNWNGKRSLNVWSSKYANMINGTASPMPPPFVVDEKYKMITYNSGLCRSIYAVYESTVSHYGVNLMRFSPPPEEFANASVNPNNAGFCVPPGQCLGTGLSDMKNCISIGDLHVPVVTSHPHFAYADQRYIDAIIGINQHQPNLVTQFDIEPLTGIPMKVSQRLQINININNTHFTRNVLKKTPSMIYPVVWLNQTASVSKKDSEKVRFALAVISYIHLAQILAFASAALLLLSAIIVYAVFRPKHQISEELTPLLNGKDAKQDT